jgi:hypothetical protein
MIKDRDKFLSFWFTLIEMEERVFSLNGYQAVYDFKNSKKKKKKVVRGQKRRDSMR